MNKLSNKEIWEARSSEHKSGIEGVLFKRFSPALNNHLHNFHSRSILENIPDNPVIKILDVGCGYGRNTLTILKKNKDQQVEGMDISKTFTELYRSNTGKPAFAGSLEDFPENMGTYDYLMCVTVLMYVPGNKMEIAVKNMASHVKKGGKLILIEPHVTGSMFLSAFGLLNIFGGKNENSNERCFTSRELKAALSGVYGSIIKEKRIPVTTILILPLYTLSLILPNSGMVFLLKIVNKFDVLLEDMRLPSLYTGLSVQLP